MAYDVFISYRRDGGGTDARMMYDRLRNDFDVSFDMDTLQNGNFNEELLRRIAECRNFIVLLSKGCFDRTLSGCERKNDWLCMEIATALYNNKNIVTVMLPGFEFPKEKLPDDIDPIRYKNGPKYDLYYIDGFYDRLKKDFLIKNDSSNIDKVSKLENALVDTPQLKNEGWSVLDVIGDDTDFLRAEALVRYEAVSRLLPYPELENLDMTWKEAELKKSRGDFKNANIAFLKVIDLCNGAPCCSSAFAMKITADGIDTRKRDWFDKALARAQSGDTDYEYGVGTIYAEGLGVAKNTAAAFRWFERAARHENLQAMAAVGAAYSTGSGVETDYKAALDWLQKASSARFSSVEERMGFLYENGYGVNQDFAVAREHYEKAAENGNSAARAALGRMYLHGKGVEIDRERAIAYFRDAAADDNSDALRILATLLFEEAKDADGYRSAISFCRRAVDRNDIEAICVLGRAYENGWGVDADLKKAGELYEKAKALGSVSAIRLLQEMKPETQYELGMNYLEGRGVPQNFEQARDWFLRAANQGHTHAMAWYGRLLEKGQGGKIDFSGAIDWYGKSAEKGSAIANYGLAQLYSGGNGVKEDKIHAKGLYEKAIALWNDTPKECRWLAVYAFKALGGMYESGKYCEKNLMLAARLYRFAAKAGCIGACRNLGISYRDGSGVQKSEQEMKFWFSEMWRLSKESLNPCDGDAMQSLGLACQSEQGVPRSLEKAAFWWHRGMAQLHYGCMVQLSNVGKQHPEIFTDSDENLIFDFYKRYAVAGHRVSLYNLGLRYRYGRNVKADSKIAFDLFCKSAELGYSDAMLSLSEMYESGDGVERNRGKGLEWIQRAAEADNSSAQLRLATRYKRGTSLERNFAEMLKWINKVLEKNPEDVTAVRALALAYRDGLGVEKNPARTKELYASIIGKISRLAEDQKAGSQDDLADCYYRGLGVEKNPVRAMELYEKAAAGKNTHAMNQLRRFYRYGVVQEPDEMKSAKWAKRYLNELLRDGGSATRGLGDSCVTVGNFYRWGIGVPADSKQAFSWFLKATEKKSWGAMLKLSHMCMEGEGCKRSKAKSVSWAKQAVEELEPLARNRDAEAQCALADCYVRGWGVNKSNEQAFQLYKDACEGGDWTAACRLARFYVSGAVVPKDEAKALELMRDAAERNSGEAQNMLGECYEKGELVETDLKKAFEWYRQSASEGDKGGLFNVGRCYEYGISVEVDHAKALTWLKIAAAEVGDFWEYSKKATDLIRTITGEESPIRKKTQKTSCAKTVKSKNRKREKKNV